MPIHPDLKKLYPPNWAEISQRIRFGRARGRCENCGVRHGWIRTREGLLWSPEVIEMSLKFGISITGTKIVLTTAHLNHDPRDNRDENLAALCQKCHLAHDLLHHLASRRRNQEQRTGQGRLFER